MRQILHPLFSLLACVTRQDLARQVAYLKEENRILRSKLPKQISVTVKERNRLVKVGKKLGAQLKDLISIVTYGSFLRWVWTMRGFVDLYFLVFIHLGTRRCWISPSTEHPESAWCCQQARNFLMHTEDVEVEHRFVMRDNDAKYTKQFDDVLESSDTEVKKNTPESPNLRAHVERFIQTHQIECLDKFVVVSESHLNLINREFQAWYNYERPHSAREHLPPGCDSPPESNETVRLKDVTCHTRLGGVLKTYLMRAA